MVDEKLVSSKPTELKPLKTGADNLALSSGDIVDEKLDSSKLTELKTLATGADSETLERSLVSAKLSILIAVALVIVSSYALGQNQNLLVVPEEFQKT